MLFPVLPKSPYTVEAAGFWLQQLRHAHCSTLGRRDSQDPVTSHEVADEDDEEA